MRVVANVWDHVQLRPWNGVGRPFPQRRKVRAVLFAADHERVHFDVGPVVDLPLALGLLPWYGASTASRSWRIQRAAFPSS